MTTTPTRARRTRRTRRAALALTATLALTLTACGGSDDDADAPAAPRTAADGSVFNDADVTFATEMIPHHAQAVAMVDLMDGRTLDPALVDLGEGIREAQTPEIQQMSAWLTAWDEPVPETVRDHANAHGGDHGGDDGVEGMEDMEGMLSADQMAELESADDAAFADLWVEGMIAHHEGAVAMAETEIEDGANEDAVALAEQVVTTQSAEIEELQALLG